MSGQTIVKTCLGGFLAAFLLSATASAAECEPSQDPSPQSSAATGITFTNGTSFAMRVFWVSFEGFLEPFGDWIQPGENLSFDTFIGHNWFVEVNTPDGAVCSGVIRARDQESCRMRILYEGGIGYDGGFCDFEP